MSPRAENMTWKTTTVISMIGALAVLGSVLWGADAKATAAVETTAALRTAIEKRLDDHEERIRSLEAMHAKLDYIIQQLERSQP